MTPNATCTIKAFSLSETGTNDLQRTWAETEGNSVRCRMEQASVAKTDTVLGEVGPQLYHCAVFNAVQPQVGWIVRVKLDTEEDWHDYTVRDSRKRFGHWHLLVERG